MEELQCQNNNIVIQTPLMHDHTFLNQIKNIENQRKNILHQLLKNRRQLKQNIKFYTNKKLIIPSTLKLICSFNQPFNTKAFYKNYRNISSIDCDQDSQLQFQNKKQSCYSDKIQEKTSARLLDNQKFSSKWKLEISVEQKNCLNCRKQLKTGTKFRQKQQNVSDQKIRQSKTAKMFRLKPNMTNCTYKNEPQFKIRVKNRKQFISKTIFYGCTSDNQMLKINNSNKNSNFHNGMKYISIQKMI